MNRDVRLNDYPHSRRRAKFDYRTLAALPLLLALCACSTAGSKQEGQRFVPISRAMERWGPLQLSPRTLQLEGLKGEMQLEYVGAMGETAGNDLIGASVFRIKNADKFFKANRDQEQFCKEPIHWVALNSKTGAPAWSSEIWVALLTIEDWAQYTPNIPGYCAGGKYVRDLP